MATHVIVTVRYAPELSFVFSIIPRVFRGLQPKTQCNTVADATALLVPLRLSAHAFVPQGCRWSPSPGYDRKMRHSSPTGPISLALKKNGRSRNRTSTYYHEYMSS